MACREELKPGGCKLNNLQCRFPDCERDIVMSDRRINLDDKFNHDKERHKHADLKEIAGRLLKLSYTDMRALASLWDAKNGEPLDTAGRFIKVAEAIEAGEYDR